MGLILSAFLIGAGIAAGTAIQAMLVGLVGKRVPIYLFFGVTCFGVCGILLTSAAYHRAASVPEAITALRWMATSLFVALPAFFLFVSRYTGQSRARGFFAVALFFGLAFILNLFAPFSLRYASLVQEPPLRFSWGEELAMFSGELTLWAAAIRVAMLLVFAWAFWRGSVQYRAGQRRQALFLMTYLALQCAGVLWGGLTEMGMVASFYIGPFAFLALVILMSTSMALDLRAQNLQIARMAVEWRETFDNVRTPIIVTDAEGLIVRVNQAAGRLAGSEQSSLFGSSIARLEREPWQTATQLVRHMARQLGATSTETKDSEGRTWDLTVAPFSSAEAEMERFILVLWDITGIVELQEALHRNETMSAMGTLIAGVAHEVRNPLFGISATLDAYEEELSTPEYAPCAAALRKEVRRLKHLMQELLDYGKPAILEIEQGTMAEVIRQAIEGRSTRDSPVLVAHDVPDSLPALLMDRGRLRQVFENLLDNATQHSPADGIVQVRAALAEHGGRTWIECTVEDDGPGFVAEDVAHAFEPFFTKRLGGTGLGLSIVQRIVEEHSGKVFAGNAPEGGARIRVLLPVAES